MPSCFQLADPVAMQFLSGASNTANWTWDIPASEVWFGRPFYQQAYAVDPTANSAGLTTSNGGAGVLGF